MDTYNNVHEMKYRRVASESEKCLIQEVYTNKTPFENPVIPEVLTRNVDDMVDNSHITWRGCGQLSTVRIPKEEEKNAVYKLYSKKLLDFQAKIVYNCICYR